MSQQELPNLTAEGVKIFKELVLLTFSYGTEALNPYIAPTARDYTTVILTSYCDSCVW